MIDLETIFDGRVLQVMSIAPALLGFFLAFVLVTVGLMRILPGPFRKPLLLVSSLLFGQLFLDPLIAGVVLAVTLLLYVIQWKLPAGRVRLLAAAALLGLVFVPFCLSGVIQDRAHGNPDYFAGNLVLVVVFFKRAVYYCYELHHGRIRRRGPVDFLVGFLSLPFLLGRAPIVSHSHLWERHGPVDRRALWSGAKTTLFAVLHLVAMGLLAWRYFDIPFDAHLAENIHRIPYGELLLLLGLNYLAFYLFRYGHDQLSVGAARLLGFAIDDNYVNPLAATDYADFWRRWNIHFRQMLVSMFYYPVVLWLSRRNPRRKALNVIGACTAVFTAHGFFMLFTMGMFVPTGDGQHWLELAASLVIYEILQISLTAGSLLLLGRAHRTGRWRWVGIPLGVSLTFTLRALMLLLIWRRGMSLTGAAVVLMALMP